jgi:tyrosine aminotransferase
VDNVKFPPKDEAMPMLSLSIGDPTVFGNLPPSPEVDAAVAAALATGKANGYCPAHGRPDARAAIAKQYSYDNSPLTADDVVIASGASGALALAIPTVCGTGDAILLPRPCFSTSCAFACFRRVNHFHRFSCSMMITLA